MLSVFLRHKMRRVLLVFFPLLAIPVEPLRFFPLLPGMRKKKTKSMKPKAEEEVTKGPQYFEPSVPVAMNGGDPWVGWRVTSDELNELTEAATSTIRGRPVMAQFHPRRSWLWQQWQGTIVRSVLQNEVKLNMAWAILSVGFVWHVLPRILLFSSGTTGGTYATSVFGGAQDILAQPLYSVSSMRELVIASLKPIENFWALTQTLVAFVLSFFLSQTYAVWRDVYTIARRVQGRLSDQGLILTTHAERDKTIVGRPYTKRALDTIETWARYARLFNMLFFASVTRRFAPLATPKGLQALQAQGALTKTEVDCLMSTTSWHQTVALWMATLVTSAVEEERITGGASVAYQSNTNTANLRAHYAQMADKLSGRMPLAYTHLVQLFVDTLCFAAPLALVGPLGAAGAVVGTGAVTLFYAGVLALAKMFLDPFDNEDFGGRSGIRLEADTLVQEVNALTRRWTTAIKAGMPPAVFENGQRDKGGPIVLSPPPPPIVGSKLWTPLSPGPSGLGGVPQAPPPVSSSNTGPQTTAPSSSSSDRDGARDRASDGAKGESRKEEEKMKTRRSNIRQGSRRRHHVVAPKRVSKETLLNAIDANYENENDDDDQKRPKPRDVTTKKVKTPTSAYHYSWRDIHQRPGSDHSYDTFFRPAAFDQADKHIAFDNHNGLHEDVPFFLYNDDHAAPGQKTTTDQQQQQNTNNNNNNNQRKKTPTKKKVLIVVDDTTKTHFDDITKKDPIVTEHTKKGSSAS